MTRMTRRTLLKIWSALGLQLLLPGLRRESAAAATCASQVRLGALRWDAWYAPDSVIGKATETTLGPSAYHFRLPFFAKVKADQTVRIDGNRPEIMAQEIAYAEQAGLSFWAFDAYDPDDIMSNALHLYLKSPQKSRINFCMMAEAGRWAQSKVADWHVKLMADPAYEKVLGGRPLYFLAFLDDKAIQRVWGGLAGLKKVLDRFRAQIRQAGLKNPYITLLGYNAAGTARYAKAIGCDAIGSYAVNNNRRAAPFSRLAEEAQQLWQAQAATGRAVVPIITTGFDQRPRIENPVPWAKNRNKDTRDMMNIYYETAEPEEIESEVAACLKWMAGNRRSVPAQTALVYAWNENDEGGWLIPTYPDDSRRLQAVARALCGRWPA
jgi:hypothetical protein